MFYNNHELWVKYVGAIVTKFMYPKNFAQQWINRCFVGSDFETHNYYNCTPRDNT